MRDIKFRGKRVDNGEWVYGDLVKIHTRKGYGYGIRNTVERVNDGIINLIPEEVMPQTVGQYTGLKDKNGKEIYEGDIVQVKMSAGYSECYEWEKFQIKFISEKQLGRFIAIDRNNESWNITSSNEIEVIGNVYEDGGLLDSK
ncbi:MAG: hypothetical protein GX638_19225 [Crenarchaeota archaeon]|nr:hypothetical protein [Thermoproteota archaeon]